MKPRIYLDNNASTPLDPQVIQLLTAELQESIGNPSSIHHFGQELRNRMTKARRSIAAFLKVKPAELVFTSGGTEALNQCIRGLFAEKPEGHIVTSAVEHSCVYSTVKFLEKCGCQATYLHPDRYGAVRREAVQNALRPDTRLVTLMSVNNETGVKTDIEAIAALLHERRIPFVVDGVAQMGKELFTIPKGVSAYCASGHKFHAPKGIGFAWIHPSFKIAPLLIGGGQEANRRGGTENLSGILGMAEAVSVLEQALPQATQQMERLRNHLEIGLLTGLPDLVVNGTGPRICNTSNISFLGVDGESLMMNLDLAGIAISHGSACSSGALEPSRVLLNMGIPVDQAASSLRLSLSRMTTEKEIDTAVEIMIDCVKKLRMIAPSKKNKTFIPASSE